MNDSPAARLQQLFEGHRLTPTQRRIAHSMVRRAADVPFLSSVELAELAGVSQPSVTRFAVALGFDGYPALRKHLREVAPAESEPDQDGLQRVPAGGAGRDREPAPAVRAARRPDTGRSAPAGCWPRPARFRCSACAPRPRRRAASRTSRPRSTRTYASSTRAARCSPTASTRPAAPVRAR